MPAGELAASLARKGLLVGPDLGRFYDGLDHHLLIAVTEKRTEDDIKALAEAIEKEMAER